MKLGFLFNILLLAALILAQDDDGMEIMDDSEMEEDEEDNQMEMMAMAGQNPMMADGKNETMMMEMNRRKKNKGMKDVFMAAMLVKSLITTMLSFVSPVMQVKGFGLSVINTLVNVARFILDMRRMMPMIRNVMAGWADRIDPPPVRPTTIQANRKTIQVPEYAVHHKYYKSHQYIPDRHMYPSAIKPLTSIYLPATTYAPHRSPFRHYYTRHNKDLSTPMTHWAQHDDTKNFLKKSLDVSPTQISLTSEPKSTSATR